MPTWLIIVLVVLVVLAVGGAIARTRQLAKSRPYFDAHLEQVNRELAAAAAQDRGWDRETPEQAARRVYAAERGSEPASLTLVEVVDRPGTDEDKAVFQVGDARRGEQLTLGRQDGAWVLETLQ